MTTCRIVACGLLLGFVATARATFTGGEPTAWYLPGGAAAEPDVPAPGDFLGYPYGRWHVPHARIAAYFRELELTSARVKLETYGHTHEGRPLLHAAISSPENIARLEAIRTAHLRRFAGEPAEGAEPPLVILLGYGVHGNEPSATHAALLVAYHLASTRDPEILALLEHTVILVDPCLNPDGFDRHTTWVNANRGMRPSDDPADREHNEPWPGGRTNHFWFDLNRDYLALVHPESQAWVGRFHRWKPAVVADVHEMGANATYYFQPGVPARENPSIPDTVRALTRAIAEHHAGALDALGSSYWTREQFDDFYAGKGSTYTDLNGAVGILFEQASARGFAQRNDFGGITFPRAIRNQVAATLATARAAGALRERLAAHQRAFAAEARAAARASDLGGWLVETDGDPVRLNLFLDLLGRHGIDVRELTAPVDGAAPGAAVFVPADQAQFRFAHEMFTRRTTFEDEAFYDISAWNVPLGYGLAFREVAAGAVRALALGEPARPRALTAEFTAVEAPVAYVVDGAAFRFPRALQRLHDAGARVRIALEPLGAIAGRTYPRGSAIVLLQGQQDLRARIEEALRAAAADGVASAAVGTSLNWGGIDLGGPSARAVDAPRVALVVGPGVTPASAGEAWYLLNEAAGLAPVLLETTALQRADLDGFTHVVLPDGTYRDWGDAVEERLRAFVDRGGTLVALERAASWVVRAEIADATLVDEAGAGAAEPVAFAEAGAAERRARLEGAILGATFDLTHPLAYGLSAATLGVMALEPVCIRPLEDAAATPGRFQRDPLAGYVPEALRGRFDGAVAAAVDTRGRGCVVLLPGAVAFRGYFHGSSRLLLNAVYLSGAVRSRGGGADE